MPTMQTQTSQVPLRLSAPASHNDYSHPLIAPPSFTGKERDTESCNDYFGARYYASTMGRFLSPDPLDLSGMLENPQTLNRYTYGMNNPLIYDDPTGELWNY